MDLRQRWAQVVSVAQVPHSVADRDAALRLAVTLGPTVADAAVGCSITERVDAMTYRTVTAANDLSVALDQAQYDAQDGPCLAAADNGTVHRIDTLTDQTRFRSFAAAALGHGVQSSLSVPLPDPGRPAAVNFYASAPGAFQPERARAVAGLLARCLAPLLPGGTVMLLPAIGTDDLEEVRSRRTRIDRALAVLMNEDGLSRSEAFARLVRRSRDEQRSVHDIANDVLADDHDRTVAS